MKTKQFIRRFLIPLLLLAVLAFFAGCQDEMTVEPGDTGEPTTDQAALEKLADQDSSLTSFEANYNEDGLMDFLGKTTEAIYPFRVGHKMRLVSKNLNIEFEGDTIAYGRLTKTFEGVLFIAASYDSTSSEPDTVIEKAFTSVITRNLIFKKIARTDFPRLNWKLVAISLPEGGTQSPNIDITKLTIFLPDGDTIVVESPNEYFLRRWDGWWRQIPIVRRGESVLLRVELFSAYEEEDFVTLTYGADRSGHHRAKKLFELVSSTPVGDGFEKVYEQTFTTHQFPGHFHAVINALPRQVIYDDAAPVENEMWGIPYFVHQ
ncbi:MAG: hypothetical protein O6940_02990 [Ignavibacteria bacterium]|nr:hypothetical protein [Ignavibacteria bacterium]